MNCGTHTAEAAVVGGGPAGLTCAIALAAAGVETALIAPRKRAGDNRTTALLAGSVAALGVLGVWPACRDDAAALKLMRIVDDRPGLLRAPEAVFAAAELGLDAFGYNIQNRHLAAALEQRAASLRTLVRIEAAAQEIAPEDDAATVALAGGGSVRARLVVGADGRHSLCRAAAGITRAARSYPQIAFTRNLGHARPHHGVSTEFHTRSGPFTLVPLPGDRSSLVWVLDPAEARDIAALDPAAFDAEIERRAHSILGRMRAEPERGEFPLVLETAERFGANRVALIGEAAHVVPPLGAQGLNLGLRDAATLAELAIAARRAGGDVGAPELLARYERLRRPDVAGRALAIDLLNRSLLSDFLPLDALRGFGLFLLDRVTPLRRAAMREGLRPRFNEPRLMRGEPL
jgi:2-octaprenyl-6-methoxyphenol hydroxylase